MADGSHHYPKITLAAPIVEEWGWLARRMRPDEIAQHMAANGDAAYDANTAALRFINTPGPVWVFLAEDGLPVAAGGFCPLRPGVYEAWLVGTLERWDTHWRPMTRLFRRMCHEFLGRADVHRLQITALASRTAAHTWYERGLGFHRDGLLPAFCADGQDAIIYSLTKGKAP